MHGKFLPQPMSFMLDYHNIVLTCKPKRIKRVPKEYGLRALLVSGKMALKKTVYDFEATVPSDRRLHPRTPRAGYPCH